MRGGKKNTTKLQRGGQLEATGEEMSDFFNNQGSLGRPGDVIEFVSLKRLLPTKRNPLVKAELSLGG